MSEKKNSNRPSPTRLKKSSGSSPHEISEVSSSSTVSSSATADRSKCFLENRRKIEQHLNSGSLGAQSDLSCKKSQNDTFKKQKFELAQSKVPFLSESLSFIKFYKMPTLNFAGTSKATKELVAFFDKKQKESFSVGAAKGREGMVQIDSPHPIAGTVDFKSLRQANQLLEILKPDSDESATSTSSSSSSSFCSASSTNNTSTSYDSVVENRNTIMEAMRTKMEIEKST